MPIEKSALDKLKIDRKPERNGGSGKWIVLFVVLALVVAAFGAWQWLGKGHGAEVRVARAREIVIGGKQTVLNATGYVEARRKAVVSSKVVGKVTEILIEEGVEVKAGDVLARLDIVNIDANLKLAHAQLRVAESSLGETEALLKEARLQLDRTRKLAEEKVAAAAELDTAVAAVESLEARLMRQKEEISVSGKQIQVWEQELEDRIIRAPFAGVVVSKDAQPGEMISPNSAGGGFTRTGICTIVDMASLEIEVDVNESYINRVREGQPVEATLDAYTDWRIPCKVIAIIPTADRQKATVKVRIGFTELEDPRILPDMGVKVAFKGVEQEEAEQRGVAVPRSAIRSDNGKDIVLIVAKGKVERRAVKTSDEGDDPALLVSGLSGGEQVVTDGPDELQDGDAVKVKSK